VSAASPIVVAHRGASAYEPEHTWAAFTKAVEDGADAIECDVRLTKDGQIVCMHDRDTGRTSTTAAVISESTLSDLEGVDFGTWRDGRSWPDRPADAGPAAIVRLEQLLELAVDTGIGLAIETKHPVRFGGAIEREVVTLLDRYGLADNRVDMRIRVMSFSYMAVRRMAELAPSLPTVYLSEYARGLRGGAVPSTARAVGPSIEVIRTTPDFVRRAHDEGRQVHVWTVDDEADVALCVERGVDAIITNRPSDVLGWVRP
jgi:glycerophosphoryl diester phosphodiesterase